MPNEPMTRAALLAKIRDALADVTEDDQLELSEKTTPEEVPDWDSVNHMKLIIVLETELAIRFETAEITGVEKVADLIDLVRAKL